MQDKFISPLISLKRTNDVFSKHILSRKEHKAFLIDLLNAVIFDKGHQPEDEKILDVSLEDRVLSPLHPEDKIGILDIRAHTRKRIYTIEIQQYFEKDIGARSYYYASKVLGGEITRGVPYHKLTPYRHRHFSLCGISQDEKEGDKRDESAGEMGNLLRGQGTGRRGYNT